MVVIVLLFLLLLIFLLLIFLVFLILIFLILCWLQLYSSRSFIEVGKIAEYATLDGSFSAVSKQH
jgi:hypothetical protein